MTCLRLLISRSDGESVTDAPRRDSKYGNPTVHSSKGVTPVMPLSQANRLANIAPFVAQNFFGVAMN